MSKEPTNSEFIEGARALIRQGVNDAQWEFATLLRKACKRLDKAEAENKRINAGWAMESQLRENLLQENCNYETKIKELKSRLDRAAQQRKDLLDACKLAFDYHVGLEKQLQMAKITDKHSDLYNTLEAAIAKAEKEG